MAIRPIGGSFFASLRQLRVNVYLGSSTRISGYVSAFDARTVLLKEQSMHYSPQILIYRHAMATLNPNESRRC